MQLIQLSTANLLVYSQPFSGCGADPENPHFCATLTLDNAPNPILTQERIVAEIDAPKIVKLLDDCRDLPCEANNTSEIKVRTRPKMRPNLAPVRKLLFNMQWKQMKCITATQAGGRPVYLPKGLRLCAGQYVRVTH